MADGQHVGLGLVTLQPFLDLLVDLLLVATRFHVDEIEDDDATDVAETELSADFLGGFDVHFQDGAVVVAFLALVTSGVDVDGDEGLGFVDDDIAAGAEGNLSAEGGLELAGDAESIEDGLMFVVVVDLFR